MSSDPGFGVYVHWPFCAAKCPYCDFNSHVRLQGVDQPRFAAALAREIVHFGAHTPGRTVQSIFLGGGTPSLMEPATVAHVLEAIARTWSMAPDVEITLEANPTSVEAGRFEGYRAAGVNRVSLGVQSLNDEELKRLGRMHSSGEARAAIAIAQRIFDRYSFDLIYARPAQTPEMWATELREALTLAGDHLSLYQLTIEEGTPYAALHAKGKLVMPDEATSRALWDTTQEICGAAGLPAYEISNHARPGQESRHNLVYWRSGEWACAGPGAHARLNGENQRLGFSSERHPETWLERVEKDGQAFVLEEVLDATEAGDEYLLMGLRLIEGIDLKRFEAISGRALDRERIDALVSHGLIERIGDTRLRVTAIGMPVLDAVVADLAA